MVDESGRCIGILSATDFIHLVKEGAQGIEDVPPSGCPYQVRGRLFTGQEAVICTLAEGNCPLQRMQPFTGGRHIAVCTEPNAAFIAWQQMTKDSPEKGVRRYMTASVVTIRAETSLSELVRAMIRAHIHRLIVVDEERRPIGIVSSTDLLAALTHADSGLEVQYPTNQKA